MDEPEHVTEHVTDLIARAMADVRVVACPTCRGYGEVLAGRCPDCRGCGQTTTRLEVRR